MSLGTNRTRNWGKEDQSVALAMALRRRSAAFQVRSAFLYFATSRDGVTLPFNQSCACLQNVKRGRWEAYHLWDGRLLATGISERDVIRSTLENLWKLT